MNNDGLAQKPEGDLAESEEFDQLKQELERLHGEMNETLAGIDENEFDVFYQDFAIGE